MEVLGVDDIRFLGGPGRYRDSGMMGTPANEHPRAFWNADLEEAVAHAVAVVREVRPQVVVTYDENGGYGHPDHIQAHRVAMARRRRPPRTPRTGPTSARPGTSPRSTGAACPGRCSRRACRPWRRSGSRVGFEGIAAAEDVPSVVTDDQVAAAVDGRAFAGHKDAAMRAHATQISVDFPFFALSNRLGQEVLAVEYYRLVKGDRGPAGDHGWEDDLFAGLTG